MKRALHLIVILLLAAAAGSAQSKTGTSVGQFLLSEPSARVAAMGNAGSTASGEMQSAYYNPASIGLFAASGVQFTHSPWIADITYDYAGAGVVLGDAGNIYASVTSLNSGEIGVTTVDQPLGTGEQYSVTDLAFALGYGRRISDRFSVGFQASFLEEMIWHSSMSAFALNVGTLYRISENGLHIGASISNFGTRAKFDGNDLRILYDQNPSAAGDNANLPAELFTEDFSLPILFRVGLGMPLVLNQDNTISMALDAFHPGDNVESMSVGAEWGYAGTFFVRGGYQNLFMEDSEVGLTLGGGVKVAPDTYRITFDYGWADHGRLKETHRFTLGISF